MRLIKSKINEGSVFIVTVPVVAISGAVGQDFINKELKPKLTIPQRFKNILIVDDSEISVEILKRMCKTLHVQYQEANDGLEAVNLSKENEFDLILMDLNMPNMNGFEAIEQIKRLKGAPEFVAVSGSDSEEVKARLKELGISNLLVKPVSRKSLIDVLSGILTN